MKKIERIILAYEKLKDRYHWMYNDIKTRKEISKDIKDLLGDDFNVFCNETNNFPELIYMNYATADVSFINENGEYDSVTLVFGPTDKLEDAFKIIEDYQKIYKK